MYNYKKELRQLIFKNIKNDEYVQKLIQQYNENQPNEELEKKIEIRLMTFYKKWFETNYPHIPVHSFVQANANFQVPGRLGDFHDKVRGWVGIRIKRNV